MTDYKATISVDAQTAPVVQFQGALKGVSESAQGLQRVMSGFNNISHGSAFLGLTDVLQGLRGAIASIPHPAAKVATAFAALGGAFLFSAWKREREEIEKTRDALQKASSTYEEYIRVREGNRFNRLNDEEKLAELQARRSELEGQVRNANEVLNGDGSSIIEREGYTGAADFSKRMREEQDSARVNGPIAALRLEQTISQIEELQQRLKDRPGAAAAMEPVEARLDDFGRAAFERRLGRVDSDDASRRLAMVIERQKELKSGEGGVAALGIAGAEEFEKLKAMRLELEREIRKERIRTEDAAAARAKQVMAKPSEQAKPPPAGELLKTALGQARSGPTYRGASDDDLWDNFYAGRRGGDIIRMRGSMDSAFARSRAELRARRAGLGRSAQDVVDVKTGEEQSVEDRGAHRYLKTIAKAVDGGFT